jgi:hypothetical protein
MAVSDEPFDHTVFEIPFPVWTIVDVAEHQKRGLPHSVKVLETPEHGPVLPLFTDADLAKTWIERQPLPGKAPLRMMTARLLHTLLTDYKQRFRGNYVGIDMSKSKAGLMSGRFCPVQELLDAFKADRAGP